MGNLVLLSVSDLIYYSYKQSQYLRHNVLYIATILVKAIFIDFQEPFENLSAIITDSWHLKVLYNELF